MSTTTFHFPINTSARTRSVVGPEGVEIILVSHGSGKFSAFLNNCADEMLPLNKSAEDRIPITTAGELVCAHHVAKFDACTGCLLANGKARHTDRLAGGLEPVPVECVHDSAGDVTFATFTLSEELVAKWRRIKAIRHRKSFGRGPVGFARYFLSRLTSTNHAD